jgi:Mce-associated membrane protein
LKEREMTAQIEDLDTERTEPEDPPEADHAGEQPPTEDSPDAGEPARPSRRWLVLLVVAVLLTGLGAWSLVRADELRSSPSAANAALVDTGRTAEVSAAVTSALNQVFSYSYDRTQVTEQAAEDLLRGEARETYDQLFARVRELAPKQKLVLTTRVVSIAVQELTADTARLLVFLDQAATRADRDASNAAAAQLSVTVRLDGERWVITGLEPR